MVVQPNSANHVSLLATCLPVDWSHPDMQVRLLCRSLVEHYSPFKLLYLILRMELKLDDRFRVDF